MNCKFQLLINGVERDGSEGASEAVMNPATGESIGRVAHASSADLDEILAVAARGLLEWQAVVPWERGRIMKAAATLLREDADVIARAITLEQGKPLGEAKDEVERSADFLEWGGEEARRIVDRSLRGREKGHRFEIQTHPIGVIAAFTPWNFPMAQAAKKFAGALGAGCSIICKPSQETPGSVLIMAKALLAAGVPPAAIAVVFGSPNQISNHLISSPVVAKVTFTGSIPIGKLLATEAGKVMKPVTMELGGHAPVIVCGDVDPEKTADFLAKAKFKNAGQICLSPTRFFVEANIMERFAVRMAEHATQWRVGNGLDPQTQMGPLVSERRLKTISDLVEDARARGANILAGGERVGTQGYFYAPTVMTAVPEDAKILHEEPFGPLAPIMSFTDEEDMLKRANGLEFGLSAYIFTGDVIRQRRLSDALQYGAVGLNDVVTHHPEVELGGWKESGIGTEGGSEILAPYQTTKLFSIR
ncbi:NAD-dependent succinate-semialdehyde dehydrogenase [Pseudomonas gingeri]|uniref:NAD-dependent succinate-semialdehyde dehydrogenase n=1 Tax=Pseudomonas gingeri TaxID=117681 RepID=UPI00159FBDA1|nr:NAD-dependent succinate-semialdehyde dehydrogenase [Pseudomonas gingeri]NWD04139.1 NAD-dependent succinate-semialdehyde dehydrogenase [Pseudomonas gingeri]NWE34229.1 NAD-dependent succinate-semialdehyde dehydrogenase [Pseudomonas gingeri]NWE56519.1 NAD-dependent succinate-semialdehyde dehydrogenase [Pseudomonas gingeri]NWF05735.1 NAD-dependent succinate-semialdehyde dehydrogenase [Pseudomonas gingeri]